MEITFKIKRFNELSTAELYSLLQLRSEVFVVEQNCVYQDIDGKDEKAAAAVAADCVDKSAIERIGPHCVKHIGQKPMFG